MGDTEQPPIGMIEEAKRKFADDYLPKMSVVNLQKIASDLGLAHKSGTKAVIIQRIMGSRWSWENTMKLTERYRDWAGALYLSRKRNALAFPERFQTRDEKLSHFHSLCGLLRDWRAAKGWVEECRAHIVMERRELAARGGHKRLGERSWLRQLDDELLRLVLEKVD